MMEVCMLLCDCHDGGLYELLLRDAYVLMKVCVYVCVYVL